MGIVLDSASVFADGGGTADDISFSHTRSSGADYVLVFAGHYGSFTGSGGAPAPIAVTYGGVPMTVITGTRTGNYFGMNGSVFYLYGSDLPASGSTTVFIDVDNAAAGIAGYAVSYSGAKLQAPGSFGSSSGSGGTSTISLINVSANYMLVDAVITSYSGNLTQGSGQTEIASDETQGPIEIAGSEKLSSGGTDSMIYTFSPTSYRVGLAVSLEEASVIPPEKARNALRYGFAL